MATLTIATPARGTVGSSYAQNVGHAARVLLAALFAVPQRAATETKVRKNTGEVSLMRLYRMSCSDSVMPNLAQELDMIARRNS